MKKNTPSSPKPKSSPSKSSPSKSSPPKSSPSKHSKTSKELLPSLSTSFQWALYLAVTLIVFSIVVAIPENPMNILFPEPPIGPPNLSRKIPSYEKTVWAPFESYYLEILQTCCGWHIIEDAHNATIMWTRDGPQKVDPEDMDLGKGQMWSLVVGSDKMTSKSELHFLLKSINATHLQPETFILSSSTECVDFFRTAVKNPDWIWVAKEPENSQGMGITINPKVSDLRSLWLVDPDAEPDKIQCLGAAHDDDQIVVQRYIRNPLLLNGKKMEIRTYWLIASVDPFVVLYHDGTVRLTTRDYKEDDWSDPLIHITNTRQQKNADPNYYATEHERKWTLQQLGDYLHQEGKVTNGSLWVSKELRPKLKETLGLVASAVWPWLMDHKIRKGWDGRFELLGMDVILDSELNMWLTEIQMGPGISLDPGVKEKVIPQMLEEMTDILLELDLDLRAGRKVSIPPKSARSWEEVPLILGKKQSVNKN